MEIYGIYQSFVLIFATAYGVSNIGGRNLFTALAMAAAYGWFCLFCRASASIDGKKAGHEK
ncbi:MAG: hypothetical protein ACLS4Z_06995 [Christensenellaceae bacterium]